MSKRYGKRKLRIPKNTVKSNTKKINRILNSADKKHHDLSATVNFTNNAPINKLTLMAEGTTSSERSGLKVTGRYVRIKGQIIWSGNVGQETVCRMIIFYDKHSDAALPVVADLLESATCSSLLNNLYNGKRFVVLKDKYFTNHNPTTALQKETGVSISIPYKKNVHYLGAGATNADLGPYNLYFCTISDATTVSGNGPTFLYNSRFYYTDI